VQENRLKSDSHCLSTSDLKKSAQKWQNSKCVKKPLRVEVCEEWDGEKIQVSKIAASGRREVRNKGTEKQ